MIGIVHDTYRKITLNEFFRSQDFYAIRCRSKQQANELCKAFNDMG